MYTFWSKYMIFIINGRDKLYAKFCTLCILRAESTRFALKKKKKYDDMAAHTEIFVFGGECQTSLSCMYLIPTV